MRRLARSVLGWSTWALATGTSAMFALPAFAQDSSSVSITSEQTSTTTSTSTELISDWRVWALVGAVILVIIIIAATRRGDGDKTTVVK
jgi:type II secretory pathway component PulF